MLDSNVTTIDISKAFPSYLSWLFTSPDNQYFSSLPLLLILSIFLLIIVVLLLLYIRLKKTITEIYIYLEVRPTDKTLKTPLSTSQLFTVLHSLEIPRSFPERFIKAKKTISYELVSTKEDGIRFVLRTPKRDVSTVKKTLLAYLPGVEIKEVLDYLPSREQTQNDQHIVIKNFKLARSYLYPLKEQPALNQHDPIAYLTAYMTKLAVGEMIALQFVCSPVAESTHPSKWQQINSIKQAFLNNEDISRYLSGTFLFFGFIPFQLIADILVFITLLPMTLISWLFTSQKDMTPSFVFEHKSKRLSDAGSTKIELYQSIREKITQPLFETTIRVYVNSTFDERGRERVNGILSAFETFNAPHQSIRLNNSFLSYIRDGFIEKFQYFQLKNRLSLFSNNPILSVTELSSLYHFPYTATTQTEDLQKIKSPQLPPPLSLKKADTAFDITFAKNKYGETETLIGQTLEERRRHTYMIGATGTGKTTLLLQMIYQDLLHGKGMAIIDPHGDLSKRVLEIIPKSRIKDVVYFNPYDIEYPIALNFLELPKDLPPVEREREKDFITSSLISVFHKLYEARYSGPRMEHILRNVILTALELEEPTLFTIYELLTNTKYRKRVVNDLSDEVLKTFWQNEFGATGSYQRAEQISPITNKLGRFLTTTLTRNILNQPKSKLNFNDIMDSKKILLCDLSKGKIGEDNSFFLGSLIIAKLELAAFRRINIPESKRIDFFLYVDEFQNFATVAFAQVLSEARKYRLGAILAHQNTVQVEADLLDTIIGNSGTIISFRTSSPKDESKILPVFSPQVEEGQIGNLPSYHFYIKINALQPQDSFTGEIDDFTVSGSSTIKEKVINNSRKVYGTITEIKKEARVIKDARKPYKENENRFNEIKTD